MQPTQADNELKEEHLLNFVVNSLSDELPVELGDDVDVTVDELYEDLHQSYLQVNRRLTPRQYRPWTPRQAVRS